MKERAVLSKVVIDELTNANEEGKELDYEEFTAKLGKVKVEDIDPLSEEMLLNNLQFVLSQGM